MTHRGQKTVCQLQPFPGRMTRHGVSCWTTTHRAPRKTAPAHPKAHFGLFLALLCLTGCVHNIRDEPRTSTFLGVDVAGDRSLLASLERAFVLLDNEDRQFVMGNLPGRIDLVEQGSGVLHTQPVVLRLAPPTIYHSLTWLASVLVHEACHINAAPLHLEPLPEERQCIARQLATARRINAPGRELGWLEASDGRHLEVPPATQDW